MSSMGVPIRSGWGYIGNIRVRDHRQDRGERSDTSIMSICQPGATYSLNDTAMD